MVRTILLAGLVLALYAQTPPPPKPAAAPAPARPNGLYATFNTSMGPIVCELFEKQTPVTVANFVALARGGKAWMDPKTQQRVTRPLYNGTIFHRVIPKFMIQGGDPQGDGYGDGGLRPIPDEFRPDLKFDQPGRLAMANAGPRTGTCQFFITETPQPHLDGLHTIFGQVVEGLELVSKMTAVPRNPDNKPNTPIVLKSVTVTRVGPPPPRPVTKKAAPASKKSAPATAEKKAAPVKK
jgi:cyclophilin family peptidyl-prolyl cis-trans isomerase